MNSESVMSIFLISLGLYAIIFCKKVASSILRYNKIVGARLWREKTLQIVSIVWGAAMVILVSLSLLGYIKVQR